MAKYRHAKGPSALQVIIIVLVAILSLALIVGAAFAVYHFASDKEDEVIETTPPTDPPATVEQVATEPATEDPEEIYTKLAVDLMSDMSDDEKIYQMLIVTPEALTGVDVATIAGDATKEAIKKYPVGGIFYTEQNFEDTKQTTELIKKSQSYASTPMFIAINEEGDDITPASSSLGTAQLEVADNSADMLKNSQAVSTDLSKLGFNLNLGTIANISGDNVYSTDATTTSSLVISAIEGQQTNGVIPALKYFPTNKDTDKDVEQLNSAEFVPFDAGIQADAPIIMASYANISAIDKDNPAFMSKSIIADLLIDELKFDGVVMTPDLSGSAVADSYTAEEVVVGAINAGANILLTPSDIDAYVDAVKTALKDGDITIEQIDNSVTKILALKYKFGIIPQPVTPIPSEISQESTQVATDVTG